MGVIHGRITTNVDDPGRDFLIKATVKKNQT